MNVLCKGDEIWIDCTHNNSRMIDNLFVQGDEVTSIVGNDRPPIGYCERENLGIHHGDITASGFGDSDAIMSKTTKFQHGGERKVFIGV